MDVTFKRTGVHRYAVIVSHEGRVSQSLDPAPGYDDDIPHDLVHYLVEAELRLQAGVFGRAARGGGTFIANTEGASARDRARQRRKQLRKDASLGASDRANDMARSEQLAALCDVAWRKRQGQRPDPLRKAPTGSPTDEADIERVVTRLDHVAPMWRALPVDGALIFEWPSALPRRTG